MMWSTINVCKVYAYLRYACPHMEIHIYLDLGVLLAISESSFWVESTTGFNDQVPVYSMRSVVPNIQCFHRGHLTKFGKPFITTKTRTINNLIGKQTLNKPNDEHSNTIGIGKWPNCCPLNNLVDCWNMRIWDHGKLDQSHPLTNCPMDLLFKVYAVVSQKRETTKSSIMNNWNKNTLHNFGGSLWLDKPPFLCSRTSVNQWRVDDQAWTVLKQICWPFPQHVLQNQRRINQKSEWIK